MAKKKKRAVSDEAVPVGRLLEEASIFLADLIKLPYDKEAANEDPTLQSLKNILSTHEYEVLRQSGVFNPLVDVEYTEDGLDRLITASNMVVGLYENAGGPSDLGLPVHSLPKDSPDHDDLLANELKYISTLTHAGETRSLASELYFYLATGQSISLLDLSDMITDSLAPSLARKILMTSDYAHKFSTAQYLQVYAALRSAQQSYELMLGRAKIDALMAGIDSIYWSAERIEGLND